MQDFHPVLRFSFPSEGGTTTFKSGAMQTFGKSLYFITIH